MRGRGRRLPRGRGRGNDLSSLRRGRFFEDDLACDDWDLMGHYPEELPLEEELYFERLREREIMLERELLHDLPPDPLPPSDRKRLPIPERKPLLPPRHVEDEAPLAKPSSNSALDTKTIMEKAKELSNIDVKNLLSAVKSIKSSSSTQEGASMSVLSFRQGHFAWWYFVFSNTS